MIFYNTLKRLRQLMKSTLSNSMTAQILIAMVLGLCIGFIIHIYPENTFKLNLITPFLTDGLFDFGGKLFITLLKFSVVPIVLVSLICGMLFNVEKTFSLPKLALKTVIFYLLTTAIAISMALFFAKLFGVGSSGIDLPDKSAHVIKTAPSIKDTFLNIFPTNPFNALAKGNMLQVIFMALLFGAAISRSGEKGKPVVTLFKSLNEVVIHLMQIIFKFAPLGVFCLVAKIFSNTGLILISQILGYFLTVLFVLAIQLLVTYNFILRFYANLGLTFFLKNMIDAMLFAFSTSSSNASIPAVLHATEKKLGVPEPIASFVIPLGATINMDGTAIMQGVATIFIANSYNIHLSLIACLKVVLMATLASIGTAGIPGIGLITLSMVLMQVNLPVEGIALIIGIDRLLDMSRTAINICGDVTIACAIANTQKN